MEKQTGSPLEAKISAIIHENGMNWNKELMEHIDFIDDAAFDIAKEIKGIAYDFAQKSIEQMTLLFAGAEHITQSELFEHMMTERYKP